MKIWVDDIRPMPEEFDVHCKSVWETIGCISDATARDIEIELISLDHDAGEEYIHGGDFIQVLCYLEWLLCEKEEVVCTKFRIHTGNPVGAERMRAILRACDWEEFRFDWEDLW